MSTYTPLDSLVRQLAALPGLGGRSARRIALHLLQRKEQQMLPLAAALQEAAERIRNCQHCCNLDMSDPCAICSDARRTESRQICVVAQVSDLWAIERTGAYRGVYFVLGGLLSALDGIGPQDLKLEKLSARVFDLQCEELILALSATVDGQSTAHYIADGFAGKPVKVTRLAHGVPIGGELGYLDDGTITTALKKRSA
jgi:recombination protein RecR